MSKSAINYGWGKVRTGNGSSEVGGIAFEVAADEARRCTKAGYCPSASLRVIAYEFAMVEDSFIRMIAQYSSTISTVRFVSLGITPSENESADLGGRMRGCAQGEASMRLRSAACGVNGAGDGGLAFSEDQDGLTEQIQICIARPREPSPSKKYSVTIRCGVDRALNVRHISSPIWVQ